MTKEHHDHELPAPPCVVPQADFDSLRRDVSEILRCLKGDQSYGHRGLVEKTEHHDRRISALESDAREAKIAIRIVGAITLAVASAVGFAVNFWSKLK